MPSNAKKPIDARSTRYASIDSNIVKPFLKWAGGKGQLLKGGHNMRCAADFRAEARAALKGRWGLAIGIGFLAMVLGGFTGMGLPEITLRFEGGDLQITLAWHWGKPWQPVRI